MRENKEHGPVLFSVAPSKKRQRASFIKVQDNLFKYFYCEDGQILNRLPEELMNVHP